MCKENWTDKITFNHYTCFNEGKRQYNPGNCTNVYIVTTRNCNVNCPFCTFRENNCEIDVSFFKEKFRELLSVCNVGVVHFTGGEPSVRMDIVTELSRFVKEISDNCITVSVNTNGTHLEELYEILYGDDRDR